MLSLLPLPNGGRHACNAFCLAAIHVVRVAFAHRRTGDKLTTVVSGVVNITGMHSGIRKIRDTQYALTRSTLRRVEEGNGRLNDRFFPIWFADCFANMYMVV